VKKSPTENAEGASKEAEMLGIEKIGTAPLT
jgi:hypothetical protein